MVVMVFLMATMGWRLALRRLLLCDEMGLGKTVTTLVSLEFLGALEHDEPPEKRRKHQQSTPSWLGVFLTLSFREETILTE